MCQEHYGARVLLLKECPICNSKLNIYECPKCGLEPLQKTRKEVVNDYV